jgi:hypothetical protein
MLESAIDRQGLHEAMAALFPVTRPRWYGLWIDGAPSGERLRLLERLFSALGGGTGEFLCALRMSLANDLPLYASLSPEGAIEGDAWIVSAHCPRCKAPRAIGRGACPACMEVNRSSPARRRKRRGMRPYRPLSRMLGAAEAHAFLSRL